MIVAHEKGPRGGGGTIPHGPGRISMRSIHQAIATSKQSPGDYRRLDLAEAGIVPAVTAPEAGKSMASGSPRRRAYEFVGAPTGILGDDRLKLIDKLLVVALDHWAMGRGVCRPTNADLKPFVGELHRKTVQNSLERLAACGYVRLEYARNESGWKARTIHLLWETDPQVIPPPPARKAAPVAAHDAPAQHGRRTHDAPAQQAMTRRRNKAGGGHDAPAQQQSGESGAERESESDRVGVACEADYPDPNDDLIVFSLPREAPEANQLATVIETASEPEAIQAEPVATPEDDPAASGCDHPTDLRGAVECALTSLGMDPCEAAGVAVDLEVTGKLQHPDLGPGLAVMMTTATRGRPLANVPRGFLYGVVLEGTLEAGHRAEGAKALASADLVTLATTLAETERERADKKAAEEERRQAKAEQAARIREAEAERIAGLDDADFAALEEIGANLFLREHPAGDWAAASPTKRDGWHRKALKLVGETSPAEWLEQRRAEQEAELNSREAKRREQEREAEAERRQMEAAREAWDDLQKTDPRQARAIRDRAERELTDLLNFNVSRQRRINPDEAERRVRDRSIKILMREHPVGVLGGLGVFEPATFVQPCVGAFA